MYFSIKTNYPNGHVYSWYCDYKATLALGSKWDENTGVYMEHIFDGMEIEGGYFEVVEKSADGLEVWLEYFKE